MASHPLLTHCLDVIEAATSQKDLKAAVSHVRDHYGIDHLAFHVVRVGSSSCEHPLLILTYPQEWVDRYLRQNYFELDPVVGLSKTGFLPVDWSCLDHASPTRNLFFKEADSFGVGRFGLTIPVRGPTGERSLFTVTSNLRETEWNHLRAGCIADFQVLSHHLHEKALAVSGLRETVVTRSLSRREFQCLDMIARGKLPKQIAHLLEISESAVRLYLRSAKRKLGVSTMPQAIVRAAVMELINA